MFRDVARKETDGSDEDKLSLQQKQRGQTSASLCEAGVEFCTLEGCQGGNSWREIDPEDAQSARIMRVKRRGSDGCTDVQQSKFRGRKPFIAYELWRSVASPSAMSSQLGHFFLFSAHLCLMYCGILVNQ